MYIAVIAYTPKPLPYLESLLPKEHEMDAQDDQEEPAQKRLRAQKDAAEKEAQKAQQDSAAPEGALDISGPQQLANQQQGQNAQNNANKTGDSNDAVDNDSQIDNPYLREIKMPKFKVSKKSKY